MNVLKKSTKQRSNGAHWAWLLPILALSPLALAAKGCDSGVVGDDCPNAADCAPGSTGSAGKASVPGGDSCGGLLGTGCKDGLFCAYADDAQCGAADQTGVCSKKPEACTEQYAPVCGCDGMTYGNSCFAKAAGTSVASKGECEGNGSGGSTGSGGATQGGTGSGGATPIDDTCGGITAKRCAKGEYCNFPLETKCGSGDQTGTCAPIAQGCPKNFAPVCGCDGNTYGNACMAAAAGVSIASNGECKPTVTACGSRGGVMCAQGEFCNYPPSSMCGRADGPGVCTKIPPKDSACITLYDPVCGCDGKTYGNDCEALNAGVSVDYEGACKSSGGDCGGLRGLQCESGFFCDYPEEMICGRFDGLGSCKAVPEVCTKEFAPVCGCDGTTYSNSCTANAAGTDVAAQGECKQ